MSPIKNRARRGLAAALMFGVVAALLLVPAEALAQASKSESVRTPYQAYLMPNCLQGSNFCKFVAEDVPARGTLFVQRVACQGWHQSTELPAFTATGELRTSANTYVGRLDFLKVTHSPTSYGSVWAISEQTLITVPTGHRLQVEVNSGTTGISGYGCTISGYLTITQ
jgi:hypothetical protein